MGENILHREQNQMVIKTPNRRNLETTHGNIIHAPANKTLSSSPQDLAYTTVSLAHQLGTS